MGHGNDLTAEEQRKIAALSLAGWNVSIILRGIRRSRTKVQNYLQSNGENPSKRHNCGRKHKGAVRMKRQIDK